MKRLIPTIKDQAGAVTVTVAILMFVLVGIAALAIDIGYLLVTRNELQNVADAAALAATNKLGNNYLNMTNAEQLDYECGTVEFSFDCTDIVTVAQEVGLANQAGQVDIVINPNDVFIGVWDFSIPPPFDPSNDPFTEQDAQPRAVRVIARRDETANNPITTFLAGIFDVDTMAVSAVATASLSGQGTAAEGELELPIGIDAGFFNDPDEDGFCHDEIVLHPTDLSCAGWTSFNLGNGVPNMRDLISGIEESPEADMQGEFNYSGGVSATLFPDLLTRFKYEGHDVDEDGMPLMGDVDDPVTGALPTDTPGAQPLFEEDGVTPLYYPKETHDPDEVLVARNKHLWETTVVVFEAGECGNPNQTAKTEGFARITLTDVYLQPDLYIKGRVECGYVSGEPTRGGGGEFGTIGSISGLVQ